MKLFRLLIAALLAAGGLSASQAQVPDFVDTNPGIFIGGRASVDDTALPAKAKKFLKKNFKFQRVTRCEQLTPSGDYEVTLGDGKEMAFDRKGNWIAISAPGDLQLSHKVLQRLLPRKAFERVVKDGYADRVYSVTRGRDGHYTAMVDQVMYDEMEFDSDGTILAFHM